MGNHATTNDPEVTLTESWMPSRGKGNVDHRATAEARGTSAGRWPVEAVIERGYAMATVYHGDIDPDLNDPDNGIQTAFDREYSPKANCRMPGGVCEPGPTASHAQADYLISDPDIDSDRIAVMGPLTQWQSGSRCRGFRRTLRTRHQQPVWLRGRRHFPASPRRNRGADQSQFPPLGSMAPSKPSTNVRITCPSINTVFSPPLLPDHCSFAALQATTGPIQRASFSRPKQPQKSTHGLARTTSVKPPCQKRTSSSTKPSATTSAPGDTVSASKIGRCSWTSLTNNGECVSQRCDGNLTVPAPAGLKEVSRW